MHFTYPIKLFEVTLVTCGKQAGCGMFCSAVYSWLLCVHTNMLAGRLIVWIRDWNKEHISYTETNPMYTHLCGDGDNPYTNLSRNLIYAFNELGFILE